MAELIYGVDCGAGAPGVLPGVMTSVSSKLVIPLVTSGRLSTASRAAARSLVRSKSTAPDQSAFRTKYEPANPAADQTGYVKYPNVNPMVEMTDMRDAQRSYEANLNIITATRRMIQRTLDILKA